MYLKGDAPAAYCAAACDRAGSRNGQVFLIENPSLNLNSNTHTHWTETTMVNIIYSLVSYLHSSLFSAATGTQV
jgi:hypothetical protein